jgi:hypothetical protein
MHYMTQVISFSAFFEIHIYIYVFRLSGIGTQLVLQLILMYVSQLRFIRSLEIEILRAQRFFYKCGKGASEYV